MASIPARVESRLVAGLKRFQPILAAAKARDIGESDTVTIVTDLLAEIFGYEKYAEITSEYAIRSTFCDLAIKIEGTLKVLIEVKAIGLDPKEAHVKQAVDYAANQGVDWVMLTNGVNWRIYRVHFTKPINQELVAEFDILSLNHRAAKDLEILFLCCKEGWARSILGEYHEQRQALSRFFLGAVLLSEPILAALRKHIRVACPDVKVTTDEIKAVLIAEVLKREVVEGDKADEARRKMNRSAKKAEKAKAKTETVPPSAADESTEEVDAGDFFGNAPMARIPSSDSL